MSAEDYAGSLRALDQLDDDRRAAHLLHRAANAASIAHECRGRKAHLVSSSRFGAARSLSREVPMACAEFSANTPICSSCRTTAVPCALTEAPIRGITASAQREQAFAGSRVRGCARSTSRLKFSVLSTRAEWPRRTAGLLESLRAVGTREPGEDENLERHREIGGFGRARTPGRRARRA